MSIDNKLVGKQIALLRNAKELTQSELGERLNVSFQAVSKWERGETLPDVGILPALADILETTVDNILCVHRVAYKGTIKVENMIEGLNCLKRTGELLGKENIIYLSAIQGINESMNTDIQSAFDDDYAFEAFVAEAVIQNLAAGMYVDVTDVKRHFRHRRFADIVCDYAKKYSIV
ncbi:MAG: helix-turn-helix transcriptional regulator [Clostridia bacterium]|nr:helix-turn-helix transcriptional regulator [Clostridia bacterium]